MADYHKGKATTAASPPRKAIAVAQSDTVDLAEVPKSLWIGGAGDLAVILADMTTSVIYGVSVGPFDRAVKRVLVTGTTATKLLAEY